MAGTTEEDKTVVEQTKVVGYHLCRGCRCFIHSRIICKQVRDGGADGHYLCGHCFAVAGLPATPPAGAEDLLPDDADESSEDVLAAGKRHKPAGASTQQQGETTATGRKKNRCKNCAQPGHNKRRCPLMR